MKSVELESWHMRFAHPNYAALRRMATQGAAVGLEELCNDGECLSVHDRKCWTYIASKQKRMSYKKTITRRATKPYQKLMSGFGPVGVETYDGYQLKMLEHTNIPAENAGSKCEPVYGDTPYARRFGESPNVEVLKIWGCIVHVFTPKTLRTNELGNPGRLGLFVGLAKNSDSVRVVNLKTGNIQEHRSVEFDEEWTVERSYVEHLIANRYRRCRYALSDVIPLVRLPVMAAVPHDELTVPPAKRQRLAPMVSDLDLNVAVEQAPISRVEPVSDPRSVPPVGAASAAAQSPPACALQQESEPLVGADHDQRGSESEEAEGVLNRRRLRGLMEMTPGADDHSEDEDDVAENGDIVASSEPVEMIESSVGAYL
ncbi:hypothetical protein PR001_g19495 [Phytophthora rubi]|uniref:Retroviral polymerase SH3-like domain-containing protein n=2 Tax=Phytophthora rubi TaxID=129364 RepID=A0A6A3JRK3_9STRA|nr:hypothetical protein PR001_g19495 [Phytophthora rubi]